jgi:hypothetical protein
MFTNVSNSAMVTSLELVAQTLEVTCDEVLAYFKTDHWKVALEHGAQKSINDITICMEDYLETA